MTVSRGLRLCFYILMGYIIPVIILNLFLGFSLSGIDNFAHIGGLIGGVFAGMIVGIEGKTDKLDRVNGLIVTIALIGFLLFMIFR